MSSPKIVAVIASSAELQSASLMRQAPDLYELRLDVIQPAQHKLVRTQPLIITARHPAEGGAQQLSSRERRRLLGLYWGSASYVDVELRSIRYFRELLSSEVTKIISLHDLQATPSLAILRTKLERATAAGADIFKVATRVTHRAELDRLLRFFDEASPIVPIAAMGIGRLGRESRIELARRGSVLNYGYISRPQAPGQLSVAELHRLMGR
ncbi:MAG: type I 3-dehydroquinate dehydratase [Chthoniobacterales bacterium]